MDPAFVGGSFKPKPQVLEYQVPVTRDLLQLEVAALKKRKRLKEAKTEGTPVQAPQEPQATPVKKQKLTGLDIAIPSPNSLNTRDGKKTGWPSSIPGSYFGYGVNFCPIICLVLL